MANLDEDLAVAIQEDKTLMRDLWVPRRRVPVEVQLADCSLLSGELYADVQSSDGTPGRVLDRLNDSQETYLPLACDNQHVLLKKSGIVSVRLKMDEEEFESRDDDYTREIHARLVLADGNRFEGMIPAPFSQKARLLDYLNASKQKFSILRAGRHVTLINGSYLLAVTELIESE